MWSNSGEVSEVGGKSKGSGNKEDLLQKIIGLHDAGVDGDKDAVTQAHRLIEDLRNQIPTDPIVEGYYGSLTALLGRDAIDPNERFKKALKGLDILDQVIQENPENIQVRTLRAYVSYRLPEMFFHRTKTAVEDFGYLISRYEQDNTALTEPFYWQLLYDLGCAYKTLEKLDEAKEVWLKLLSSTSDPKYAELLKSENIEAVKQTAREESTSYQKAKSPTDQRDKKKLTKEGVALHARALKGDKEAAAEAFKIFENAQKNNPGDHTAAAYYADCLSMKGRDADNPNDMFANAIKAMKSLDKCVNSDPDNVLIRFIRAYHSLRLPEAFFHRTTAALEDLKYFVQQYEQDNTLFSKEVYWKVLFDLGVAYKKLDMTEEADRTWQKLLSLNPGSTYHALINREKPEALVVSKKKAASLTSKEDLFSEGKRLHELGVAGNKEAVKLAYETLKKAHELDPDDPMVMGYYGSALALTARESTDPGDMFKNAIQGLVTLKKAIGRSWNNPELRLLRGYLIYSLPPAFFGELTETGIKDFRAVKSAYERGDHTISETTYNQVLYDLGVCYMRNNENEKAKKTWSKLQKKTSDPKYQQLFDEI